MDPITFTFSENSNYWQESLIEVIRQNIAGGWNQTSCFQKFVDNAQQCFAFIPQWNFPTHNLNFHWRWRWRDQIFSTLRQNVKKLYWTRNGSNASLYTIWWCIVHSHWHFLRMSFWLSLSALENDVSAAVELRTKPYCSCSTYTLLTNIEIRVAKSILEV